jgi:hypothetical protein
MSNVACLRRDHAASALLQVHVLQESAETRRILVGRWCILLRTGIVYDIDRTARIDAIVLLQHFVQLFKSAVLGGFFEGCCLNSKRYLYKTTNKQISITRAARTLV